MANWEQRNMMEKIAADQTDRIVNGIKHAENEARRAREQAEWRDAMNNGRPHSGSSGFPTWLIYVIIAIVLIIGSFTYNNCY